MHIAIDNRLSAYRIGGIPAYTQQLTRALAEVAPDERITTIEHRRRDAATEPGLRQRRVWTPPHHRWEQRALSLELWGLRADVLHFPDFIPLFAVHTPSVITVHDLAFVRYPEILDAAARRYYGQIGRALERADAVIAVSESTRRDLTELLRLDPARVDVVPEAAASVFQPLDLPPDASRTVGGHTLQRDRFALFVGTLEPRKNLLTLLRAMHLLREQGGHHGDTPELVVAGPRGWLDDDIFALVRELRLGDVVRFVGGVDQTELIWLYSACRVYLHPELYSGFGLPVLEAMQCGAPVLAADVASLPEVVGEAGLLLPPQDQAAWSDAWRTLWHDPDQRMRLRTAGFAQARRFSWQTAAQQTLAIYRRLV